MTKTVIREEVCQNCDGTGYIRNKYGTRLRCKACRNGKVKLKTEIEE